MLALIKASETKNPSMLTHQIRHDGDSFIVNAE